MNKNGWVRIDKFYKTRTEANKALKEYTSTRYSHKVMKAGGLENGFAIFYKFNK